MITLALYSLRVPDNINRGRAARGRRPGERRCGRTYLASELRRGFVVARRRERRRDRAPLRARGHALAVRCAHALQDLGQLMTGMRQWGLWLVCSTCTTDDGLRPRGSRTAGSGYICNQCRNQHRLGAPRARGHAATAAVLASLWGLTRASGCPHRWASSEACFFVRSNFEPEHGDAKLQALEPLHVSLWRRCG